MATVRETTSAEEMSVARADITAADTTFIQQLKEYLRLRERDLLKKHVTGKSCFRTLTNKTYISELKVQDRQIQQLIKICKDYNTHLGYYSTTFNTHNSNEIDEFESNQADFKATLTEMAWSKVKDHLEDLKENDDMANYVVNYTNILKLHIESKLSLDHACILGLVSCIRPSLIEEIFDLGLVDNSSKVYCLFKPRKC